jgi:hypothetical protein
MTGRADGEPDRSGGRGVGRVSSRGAGRTGGRGARQVGGRGVGPARCGLDLGHEGWLAGMGTRHKCRNFGWVWANG